MAGEGRALDPNPLQLFVGVSGTTLLYTFSVPYYGLKMRGYWVTISLIMVLESTQGATYKKGAWRRRFDCDKGCQMDEGRSAAVRAPN